MKKNITLTVCICLCFSISINAQQHADKSPVKTDTLQSTTQNTAKKDSGYTIGGKTPLTAAPSAILYTDGKSIYGVRNNKTELLPKGYYAYNGTEWCRKE